MDRETFSDDVPDADAPLPVATLEELSRVANVRTNQVRRHLIRLYGPADVRAVPRDPRSFGGGTLGSETECLDVLLFKPSAVVPDGAGDRPSQPSA
jgi:hypothetical protein